MATTSDNEDEWSIILDSAPVKFDSGEHADIPSECYIKFSAKDNAPSISGKAVTKESTLCYSRGRPDVPITFAQTIALAGDFYVYEDPKDEVGAYTNPICYAEKFEERVIRASLAVGNLKADVGDLMKQGAIVGWFGVPGLQGYLQKEMSLVEQYLTDTPDMVNYADMSWKQAWETGTSIGGAARIAEDQMTEAQKDAAQNKDVGRITKDWKNYTNLTGSIGQMVMTDSTRYGGILINNVDHFGQHAWEAYAACHTLALRVAKGGQTLANLQEAYLCDAFGLHYLSDQFSAGHTRTPRMEMHRPSTHAAQSSSQVGNKLGATYKYFWDSMTQATHDGTNAHGLLLENAKGEQWISFGDKQYFASGNRINRLRSIECVQASIDEIYQTWKQQKFPEGSTDGAALRPNYMGFAALKLAPKPNANTIDGNPESSGNPTALWCVEKDKYAQNQMEIKRKVTPPPRPANEPEASWKTPTATPRGPRSKSLNGYWFLRRKDVEDFTCTDYIYGNPGWDEDDTSSSASPDVAKIENSTFIKQPDMMPDELKPMELLAGGFLQLQEYRQNDTAVNYAVNVWGPVRTPVRYIFSEKKNELGTEGRQLPAEDMLLPRNRQFTFTWRGRTPQTHADRQSIADNKTFRWKSWFNGQRSTWLYKLTSSTKYNEVWVESWCLDDPDPKPAQQWSDYENLEKLVFQESMKARVLRNFSDDDWASSAHITRFFVFPLRRISGIDESNPNIVALSWRKTPAGLFKAAVNTVNTKGGFIQSATAINQDLALEVPAPFTGFIKRFEDVSNQGLLLYARVQTTMSEGKTGLAILPSIVEADGPTGFRATSSVIPLTDVAPTLENATYFYQILVGDTRRTGYREMVLMTGDFKSGYRLAAWKLTVEREWKPVGGSITTAVVRPESNKAFKDQPWWYPTTLRHQFCALMPNQEREKNSTRFLTNGLNVLLISTYKDDKKNWVINFRTHVKSGIPDVVEDTIKAESKSAVEKKARLVYYETPDPAVPVWWWDNTVLIVHRTYFVPRIQGTQGEELRMQRPGIAKVVESGKMQPGGICYVPTSRREPASETYDRYTGTHFKFTQQLHVLGDFKALPFDGDLISWFGAGVAIIKPSPTRSGFWEFFREDGTTRWPDIESTDNGTDKDLVTEYYWSTEKNRMVGCLLKRNIPKSTGSMNLFILNPGDYFASMYKDPSQVTNTPLTSPAVVGTPIGAQITGAAKAPNTEKASAGWKEFYDSTIVDRFIDDPDDPKSNPFFIEMGWRLCKCVSVIAKIPMVAVMRIFSFHGVIGCAVYAPREPGEYGKWVCRGFSPYMGQSSLGTGVDSLGRWNDNSSELSWGATEDFKDFNYWSDITKSWSTPPTQEQAPYKRGFQAKNPKSARYAT